MCCPHLPANGLLEPQSRPGRACAKRQKQRSTPSATDCVGWENETQLEMSVKKGLGIKKLKEELVRDVFLGVQSPLKDGLTPNLRQKTAMEVCLTAIHRVKAARQENVSPEFIAFDLQEALDALGGVIGETTNQEIIDSIFDNFCVGK